MMDREMLLAALQAAEREVQLAVDENAEMP